MPFKKILLALIGLVAVTLASGIVAYILGGIQQVSNPVTMGLVAVTLVAFALPPFLGALEVVTSKNDNRYKIIWSATMIILGGIGMVLYFFMARKDLKD